MEPLELHSYIGISHTIDMMAHHAQLFSCSCDHLTEKNNILCAFFMWILEKVHGDCVCVFLFVVVAANSLPFSVLVLPLIIFAAVLVFFSLQCVHFFATAFAFFAAVLVFILQLFSFCWYFWVLAVGLVSSRQRASSIYNGCCYGSLIWLYALALHIDC